MIIFINEMPLSMFLWSIVNPLFPSKDSFSSLSWLKYYHVKGAWVLTTCTTNKYNITELFVHSYLQVFIH